MHSPLELRKFVAPEFVFGNGARFLANRYAKNLAAKKILIVADKGIIKTGMVDELCNLLDESSLEYDIYSDISSNPRDHEVMDGAQLFSDSQCNFIIALGGGSSMDCAKGIGIVSSNKKHILDFEGVDKVHIPSPPLICIPTTAGSSADVSQFAIIMDTEQKIKVAIISKALVPDVALIDPYTTLTMDHYLTANTALDALVHSFEAFVSNASSPITDLNALDSINLISHNIKPLLNDLQNIDLRSKIMLSSLEAGLAFSNASLGLVHAMSHSLGGFLDLSHGECNAILLDHVIDFNFISETDKYLKIGKIMGINFKDSEINNQKELIINHLKELKKACGVTSTLKKLGVEEKDIPQLAENAMKDPCIVTNPRRPTMENIEEIFINAF
ncbi:MAG: alcohol dehydrogenase-like regulatory protein ErcA [Methanobacteriaceae archaeon]|nr:alcohol dehydrogenase-like regulatory protein ErcA [Methanobacteriaceae archaeon]